MRLIQLKIKNIASLKGEHLINFSEIQGHSPLFAITGETGAGKSSILNAIGLALYGQIYKKTITQVDVVTLGEKEGQIELIFQVGGKNYLAEWRAKLRKQNGELLKKPDTHRYIYPIDGESLESNRQTPIESTEELLQLNFDQFCKCIILNQGEFARFLSSSFTERKEILEKLYPGELLESVSQQLKIEREILNKEKNDLEIQVGTLNGDETSGEELQKKKTELKTRVELNEAWLKHVEGLEHQTNSILNDQQSFRENQTKIEKFKKELAVEEAAHQITLKSSEEIQQNFIKISLELEKKLPELQELLKTEESLRHLEGTFEQNSENEKRLKIQLNEIEKKIEDLGKQLQEVEKKKSLLAKDLTLPIEGLIQHRSEIDSLFEAFNSTELLTQEIEGKNVQLKAFESQGKELIKELNEIENKKKVYPPNLKDSLSELEAKKKSIFEDERLKQHALLKSSEIKSNLEKISSEQTSLKEKILSLETSYQDTRKGIIPLEATLQLQELMSAVEVCLTHPSVTDKEECPVCQTPIPASKWPELRRIIEKADIKAVKERHQSLSRSLIKAEEEIKLSQEKTKELEKEWGQKKKELEELIPFCTKEITPLEKIEEEISVRRREIWDLEALSKEENRLKSEVSKARENYSNLKNEILQKSKAKEEGTKQITLLKDRMQGLAPEVISKAFVAELRLNIPILNSYLETATHLDKLLHEEKFLRDKKDTLKDDLQKITETNQTSLQRISAIKVQLEKELGSNKASDLIKSLTVKHKEASDRWANQEKLHKQHELKTRELQSTLRTLEVFSKDIEQKYETEKRLLIKNCDIKLPVSDESLCSTIKKISLLDTSILEIQLNLSPLREELISKKEAFKESLSQERLELADFSARLNAWEKRQEKIKLLADKKKKIDEKLNRYDRLFEVLGKDELRTFVLSLVEENLIAQTNEELQKLCQGRYEIVHQSRRMKITPEFYILDKYREGGLRKVQTLSGGETFMVSLAMALALAEMTRGQAEIDSLFIDEGFGTLDQDSLEDVLDMLQQIQTRGLMVGIISHIKALTLALPVNLLVSKKQDGTSNVGLQFN